VAGPSAPDRKIEDRPAPLRRAWLSSSHPSSGRTGRDSSRASFLLRRRARHEGGFMECRERAALPLQLPTIVEDLGRLDVLCLQDLRVRAQDGQSIEALQRALPGDRWSLLPAGSTQRHLSGPDVRRGELRSRPLAGRHLRLGSRGPRLCHSPGGLAIVNVYAIKGTSQACYDDEGATAGDRHDLKRRLQSASWISAASWGATAASFWPATATSSSRLRRGIPPAERGASPPKRAERAGTDKTAALARRQEIGLRVRRLSTGA